jgi:Mg/Co/Ni transporter MgtE
MPVVDREGGLVGIVSVDDLIQLLSEEMSQLAKLISRGAGARGSEQTLTAT